MQKEQKGPEIKSTPFLLGKQEFSCKPHLANFHLGLVCQNWVPWPPLAVREAGTLSIFCFSISLVEEIKGKWLLNSQSISAPHLFILPWEAQVLFSAFL